MMTKFVKINSRGRYVSKKGEVIFGPTRNFFKKDTDTLKQLLTKYSTIEIVEQTEKKKLVTLNLDNVEKNNDTKPISMTEPTGDAANTNDETATGSESAEDNTDVDDENPAVLITESDEEVSPEVTDETPATVEETADSSEPVESDSEVATETGDVKAEETVEETTPNNTPAAITNNNNQSKKNKNKNRNKSTEVTPKEA